MPADSPQKITKYSARKAIERIPEVKKGLVDLNTSVAGFCADRDSNNYGKVWALLSTKEGPLQYSGFADETLRRTRTSIGGNYESKLGSIIESKQQDGFTDIGSDIDMKSWNNTDSSEAAYRGRRRRCKTMKATSCKKSSKCSWRKGKYSRSGKKLRAGSCAKKSRKRSRKRSRSSKRSTRRSRSGRRMRRRSSSRSSSGSRKRRRSRSGRRMRRRSRSSASLLGKALCQATPGTTWVRGKGSRAGYCKKVGRRSRRRSRSVKKMRRASKCNTTKSGKKRSRRGCKASKKCSWRKGSHGKKGYCARK